VSELVSVHTSWVEPRVRYYNTGTDESFRAVVGWGAPRENVRCFGLPVDERFAEVSRESGELRADIGLAPDRLTALLIGGGEGAGGLESIVRAIQETSLDLQLIVVCGRNEALRARLKAARLRTPAHVCGFVRTIPELMRSADVVVTKGGPQTIAESLVVGRPVILTQTIPGQEEGNGEFVERHGVGFAPGSVETVITNLRRLVDNPAERARMTENAHRCGRPNAARQVAVLAWELAGAA
jgi:1,2-diacylglycerol 3-beta-galactosyltransferase